MKIQGPNQTGFNPYTKHIKQQQEAQKANPKQDQLEISNQAKQMQENDKIQSSRQAYVDKIKEAVNKGEYQVDAEQTAKKMIDFWS